MGETERRIETDKTGNVKSKYDKSGAIENESATEKKAKIHMMFKR